MEIVRECVTNLNYLFCISLYFRSVQTQSKFFLWDISRNLNKCRKGHKILHKPFLLSSINRVRAVQFLNITLTCCYSR